jgi:hypothetical protein
MLNVLLLGVQMVDHHVGIARMAGREDNQLELLMQSLQNFNSSRPNVDARSDDLAVGERDGQLNLVLGLEILSAVNKCFI